MSFTLLSALLIIVGFVFLFDLTPERITDDMMKLISPEQTLRDRIKIAQGKKKSRKLTIELQNIRSALIATGKGSRFAVMCASSLCLLIAGGVFAIIIDNLFLIPIISTALALIPFFYIKISLAHYYKYIQRELETALSIVTTSYIRNNDIIKAVSENLSYIKPPVREILGSFVAQAIMISADMKVALSDLKERIDNQIFKEWCNSLIACQDDRTLKHTLLPVVNKLTDVRIVNNELKTLLYEPRKEYFTMVALVIGNIPLLYMLNKDWYHTLMDTLFGKIVMAFTGVVILITAAFMMRYTKPIEYKR